MVAGAGLGKVIAILAIPVLTRIYSPGDMGVLSIFSACAAIIMPIATLRYNVALPLPKRDETALNLAILCLASTFSFSLIISAIFYFFSESIFNTINLKPVQDYWWLLIFAIALGCLYEIMNGWAIREKAFGALARSAVWQSALGSFFKVTLGVIGLKPAGLLIGQLFTVGGGLFPLLKLFIKKLKINHHKISLKQIIFCLKFYSELPKYRLPSQFLLAFSMNAPVMFSAWLFGIEVSGQLGLTIMALSLPLNIVGNSVGQVYYSEVAKIGAKEAEKIYSISIKLIKQLLVISILPFLTLLIFGPWLFVTAFGKDWSQAGVFAQILAFCLLAQFISTPLVNALNVFGAQKSFLKLNIIRAIAVVTVFLLSWATQISAAKTVSIYSATLFLHYLLTVREIFKTIKSSKKKQI